MLVVTFNVRHIFDGREVIFFFRWTKHGRGLLVLLTVQLLIFVFLHFRARPQTHQFYRLSFFFLNWSFLLLWYWLLSFVVYFILGVRLLFLVRRRNAKDLIFTIVCNLSIFVSVCRTRKASGDRSLLFSLHCSFQKTS